MTEKGDRLLMNCVGTARSEPGIRHLPIHLTHLGHPAADCIGALPKAQVADRYVLPRASRSSRMTKEWSHLTLANRVMDVTMLPMRKRAVGFELGGRLREAHLDSRVSSYTCPGRLGSSDEIDLLPFMMISRVMLENMLNVATVSKGDTAYWSASAFAARSLETILI